MKIFDVPIEFINEGQTDIDLAEVKKEIEKTIPKKLFQDVEAIYFTNSAGLENYDVIYKDGCIYLDNGYYDNRADVVELITNGVAWSLQERHQDYIFDEWLQEELLEVCLFEDDEEPPTLEEYWRELFEAFCCGGDEIKEDIKKNSPIVSKKIRHFLK